MFKTTARIDGMACGMCEAHINDTVRRVFPGVKKVSSSHAAGKTEFLTEEEIDISALQKAVDETGYTFVSAECVPYKKKKLFGK